MTFLVERLAELRRHLGHLRAIAPRVSSRHDLERDLSLLMISKLVIDVAGELSARRGDRFEDYTRRSGISHATPGSRRSSSENWSVCPASATS